MEGKDLEGRDLEGSKELGRELVKEVGKELGSHYYYSSWCSSCSCCHYRHKFYRYQLLEGQSKSSLHLRINRYQQDLSWKSQVKTCFARS
jgi:hypothetical protein